jgi:hypothetical protein
MPKIYINLSFDHELSLGGTDSYSHNLFDPTERLIDMGEHLGVPLTFYTDVCCAMRFREWDEKGFYVPYRKQIHRMMTTSYEAQLHIHPHWIDSEYRDGRFIPAKTFALADFKNRKPPNDIGGIIDRSVSFLNDLCREVRPEYTCIAYRAGGFNLAPETSAILSSLYRNGIRIDSSVVKNYVFESNLSRVDFSDMPAKANWFIDPRGPINRPSNRGILEIPVPSRPRTPINNIPFLVKRILYKKRGFNPHGWPIHEGNTSIKQKLNRLFPNSVWMLAFDNGAFSLNDVMKTFDWHIKQHESEDTIILASVCHPKMMGEYERSLMVDFIDAVRQKHQDAVRFVSCRDIYEEWGLSEHNATDSAHI